MLSRPRRLLPLPRVETLVEGCGGGSGDFGGDGMKGTEGIRAAPPCLPVPSSTVLGWCLRASCCWQQCWQRSEHQQQ